jgi:hypothetical protein
MTMRATFEDIPQLLPRQRVAWIELSCLNCGELAGHIEDQRIVRQFVPGRITVDAKRRLRCGRCGGLLLTGDHGITSTSVEN